jgi:hypothetical protein
LELKSTGSSSGIVYTFIIMARNILITFKVDQEEEKRIDEKAAEYGVSRSEYLRQAALQRRTKQVITSPLTDYVYWSKLSTLVNSILDSARRGEDTVLDILELKLETDKSLAACMTDRKE